MLHKCKRLFDFFVVISGQSDEVIPLGQATLPLVQPPPAGQMTSEDEKEASPKQPVTGADCRATATDLCISAAYSGPAGRTLVVDVRPRTLMVNRTGLDFDVAEDNGRTSSLRRGETMTPQGFKVS